jgi:hypothetical protein
VGDVQIIDRTWGGTREIDWLDSARYPSPGREWETWDESLGRFPGGGLARAGAEHAQRLLAAGWSHRDERSAAGEEPEDQGWIPPPRHRRSVEQVAKVVRAAVDRLDPRSPPEHLPRPVALTMVGIVQALGDLLFYPDTDEPWAAATVALAEVVGRQRREDPEQPLFRGAGHVLAVASEDGEGRRLGAGSQSLQVAESRGRTRAHWHEVECKATHVTAGHVKNLGAVERTIDAQRSTAGAKLDPVDRAGLNDWLRDRASPATRVARYRRRLAATRGYGIRWGRGTFDVSVSDAEAAAATAELSDQEILGRLTKAKGALERHLRRLAPRAEEMALVTGDKAFLAPLTPAARPRGERRSPRHDFHPGTGSGSASEALLG